MNTSKSLDEILDTINWTKAGPSGYLDSKANERKAAVKQAIVEAVKGLIGEDDERDTVAHSPCNTACHAISTNLTKQEIRQAIKEWQDYDGLVEDSDEK